MQRFYVPTTFMIIWIKFHFHTAFEDKKKKTNDNVPGYLHASSLVQSPFFLIIRVGIETPLNKSNRYAYLLYLYHISIRAHDIYKKRKKGNGVVLFYYSIGRL